MINKHLLFMEDFNKGVQEQMRKDFQIINKFDKSVAESISNNGVDLIKDLFHNNKVSNENIEN